ncbi:MAG: hypothetical protein AAGA67_04805 [Cyanobacteria bacterium P01_F01_bin.153]
MTLQAQDRTVSVPITIQNIGIYGELNAVNAAQFLGWVVLNVGFVVARFWVLSKPRHDDQS